MEIRQDLKLLIDRFPDQKVKIIQLYLNDSNFKSLCEDFCLCLTQLEKQKNILESDLVIKKEYDFMYSLLEGELNEYLKNTAR